MFLSVFLLPLVFMTASLGLMELQPKTDSAPPRILTPPLYGPHSHAFIKYVIQLFLISRVVGFFYDSRSYMYLAVQYVIPPVHKCILLLFIILTKNETDILLIILYLIAFSPLINDSHNSAVKNKIGHLLKGEINDRYKCTM